MTFLDAQSNNMKTAANTETAAADGIHVDSDRDLSLYDRNVSICDSYLPTYDKDLSTNDSRNENLTSLTDNCSLTPNPDPDNLNQVINQHETKSNDNTKEDHIPNNLHNQTPNLNNPTPNFKE